MDGEYLQHLIYSIRGHTEGYPLLSALKKARAIILSFFEDHANTKLCLVFPSKGLTAQWLSAILTFDYLRSDFSSFAEQANNDYRRFRKGDLLILNNDALVEWSGAADDMIYFKHLPYNGTDVTGITVKNIRKLQPAPKGRHKLSSFNRIRPHIYTSASHPIDTLLGINSQGNFVFQKNKVCLVGEYKSFEASINGVAINERPLTDYIRIGKIGDDGSSDGQSSLVLSKTLSNAWLHISGPRSDISMMIVDGFSTIVDSVSDFEDIDSKEMPTVLITDLSEINSFETITNFGFEFFTFTTAHLQPELAQRESPFYSLAQKLKTYTSFTVEVVLCSSAELERTSTTLHSIEKDDSNNDLTSLRIALIQLTNLVSRVAHNLSEDEVVSLRSKLNAIEILFTRSRMWLGDSQKSIENCILHLGLLIDGFSSFRSDKCAKLEELLNAKQYDYIICATEQEAQSLRSSLAVFGHERTPSVVPITGIGDSLLSPKPTRAILTGWAKAKNIDRLFSSFIFTELTLLFYPFENRYYYSLQKRHRHYTAEIRQTMHSRHGGSTADAEGFDGFYSGNIPLESQCEPPFDIVDYETTLDTAQYARFSCKGSLEESCKAKRIDFVNSTFIYATESHKFLVINEVLDKVNKKPIVYYEKRDVLKPGDVIAFINTDRDVLVELVKQTTKPEEFAIVKSKTEMWKTLLREYFSSIGGDFQQLVVDLEACYCKRHPATIKHWLQDDDMIGPEDDADLISIAILTKSEALNANIPSVRRAIAQMTSWRMRASDTIRNKIKTQLLDIASHSVIDSSIEITDLGRVDILTIIDLQRDAQDIFKTYANRLIVKEMI